MKHSIHRPGALRDAEISGPVRSAGFTLIELMVVIVIIGIAGLVILPEMKGAYDDALLRSASRDLVNTFHLAYSRAVTLNQAHRVRIEEGSGKYFIEEPRPGGRGQQEFIMVRDARGTSGELDPRIKARVQKVRADPDDGTQSSRPGQRQEIDHPTAFTFFADGTTDGGEVLLRDRHGFGLRLRLDPITARVRISESSQP